MSIRLEEQIRRYTEAMDSRAARLEELVPPAASETLDLAPGMGVEVTVPLPAPATSRFPGWGIALAAAAAVIVLAIPLWLVLSGFEPDVVATTLPSPVATTVADAGATSGFVAVDIVDQPRINGLGWSPGVPVRVSTDSGASWLELGTTDPAGSLDFALPVAVPPGTHLTVEVGGLVTDSTIPLMTVTAIDEHDDRIEGRTDLPPEGSCCVSVFMFTDPTDAEAEEFPVTIRPDGTWMVELAGEFDVTNFTLLDVSYGDPNGLWMGWSYDRLTNG